MRTFVMVKPDGVRRGLIGEIICRLEQKGLRVVGLKQLVISDQLAERHYGEHQGKPFYAGLVKFITSGPVVAMVVEGPEVVQQVRALIGVTDPVKAAPGSIRGDLATTIEENVVHGSDSETSAQREISLFFQPKELLEP